MARPFRDSLASFPPEVREKIEARAAELIAEEYTLRDLREMLARSQGQIAEALGVEQTAVSRMERRADMYVSTLRKVIRAMGGELDVVARFPGREPVRISQFDGAEIKPAKRGRKKSTSPALGSSTSGPDREPKV